MRLAPTKRSFWSQTLHALLLPAYVLWAMFHEVLKSPGYFSVRGMPNSSHEGVFFSHGMSWSHGDSVCALFRELCGNGTQISGLA